MLDTIVYIPTILAYVFILLLVIILCFIVVYVSHKIYVCIYDSLPVARVALSNIMSIDFQDNLARSQSGIVLRSSESLNDRKAKTALRIIVTLAPSYLAYVTLGNEKINKSADVLDELSDIHQNKIIKYYDRLSQIPISNVPTCISERQLYHSSHRPSRRKTALKNYTHISTTNAPIKTVATSTTRLMQSEDMATPYRNVNASSLSTHAVRASATFANAMSALGTIKINPPEDPT